MTTLIPLGPANGLAPLSRGAGRALAHLSDQTVVAVATVQARVVHEEAVMDGIAQLGSRALQHVAMVTQLEQQLTQLVPLAASRLEAIGTVTALAMATELSDTARKLSR
jgi:hypothetical protein